MRRLAHTTIKMIACVLLASCGSKYDVLISNRAMHSFSVHLRMSDGSGDWVVQVASHSTTKLRVSTQSDAHLEVDLTSEAKVIDHQNVGYFESDGPADSDRLTCINVIEPGLLSAGCTQTRNGSTAETSMPKN